MKYPENNHWSILNTTVKYILNGLDEEAFFQSKQTVAAVAFVLQARRMSFTGLLSTFKM